MMGGHYAYSAGCGRCCGSAGQASSPSLGLLATTRRIHWPSSPPIVWNYKAFGPGSSAFSTVAKVGASEDLWVLNLGTVDHLDRETGVLLGSVPRDLTISSMFYQLVDFAVHDSGVYVLAASGVSGFPRPFVIRYNLSYTRDWIAGPIIRDSGLAQMDPFTSKINASLDGSAIVDDFVAPPPGTIIMMVDTLGVITDYLISPGSINALLGLQTSVIDNVFYVRSFVASGNLSIQKRDVPTGSVLSSMVFSTIVLTPLLASKGTPTGGYVIAQQEAAPGPRVVSVDSSLSLVDNFNIPFSSHIIADVAVSNGSVIVARGPLAERFGGGTLLQQFSHGSDIFSVCNLSRDTVLSGRLS